MPKSAICQTNQESRFEQLGYDDIAIYCVAYESLGLNESFFTDFGLTIPPRLNSAIEKRRLEYLAGRYCANQALFNLGLEQISDIKSTESRAPQWPLDFVGSITHTRNYAAALVGRKSRWKNIGIDAEMIVEQSKPALQAHVCCDGEFNDLKQQTRFTDEQLFTIIFSAKESFFKAYYPDVGRFFGFQSARLTEIDQSLMRFTILLEKDLSPELRRGHSTTGHYESLPNKFLTAVLIEQNH